VGNTLVYRDTYEQALADLAGVAAPPPAGGLAPATGAPSTVSPDTQKRLDSIRQHLQRYRDLAGQGRWAEAGKELEAIQSEVQNR